jgi:TetR/AcrR family transcriptional regulator, transcriptional repressor of bet genes
MRCVHRYDEVVERSRTEEELLDGFAAKLVETIADEAPMHRLWYDLRVESMFDERLRETVLKIDRALEDMVWRIVTRYAELADREVAMDSASAYAVLDGLFQAALLKYVTGDPAALPTLVAQTHGLMPLTLGPLPRSVSSRR